MSRIIAIGDIHGYYTKLRDLLDKVEPTYKDQIVFLGDYVDYGPQVPEVIEYLIEFRKYYRVSYILGNHDSWFLDYLLGGEPDPAWLFYGGMATLEAYSGKSGVPESHVEFLKLASAPIQIETLLGDTEYWFSHGMLCPTKPIEPRRGEWDALWGRPSSFGYTDIDGTMRRASKKKLAWKPNQYLIFGHTPFDEPTEFDGIAIGIDTGAKMKERPLTALITSGSAIRKFTFMQSNALEYIEKDTEEMDATEYREDD